MPYEVYTIRIGDDAIMTCLDRESQTEILDINVSNDVRRTGLGRRLLEKLFVHLGPGKRVFAITRVSNEVAQQFWESCRFEVSAVLRRFYELDGADAIVYVRNTGGPV